MQISDRIRQLYYNDTTLYDMYAILRKEGYTESNMEIKLIYNVLSTNQIKE